MIETGAREDLHAWLVSDRPRSRKHAFAIRAYSAWRTFAANRLAVAGLLIVVALVLVAVARHGSSPRRLRTGSAPTTRAATSCRA
jgi:peptide/nickel transport system permease protein